MIIEDWQIIDIHHFELSELAEVMGWYGLDIPVTVGIELLCIRPDGDIVRHMRRIYRDSDGYYVLVYGETGRFEPTVSEAIRQIVQLGY